MEYTIRFAFKRDGEIVAPAAPNLFKFRGWEDLHDFPLGRFNRVPPRVPLQPLRQR
jgi:hypothetical protein